MSGVILTREHLYNKYFAHKDDILPSDMPYEHMETEANVITYDSYISRVNKEKIYIVDIVDKRLRYLPISYYIIRQWTIKYKYEYLFFPRKVLSIQILIPSHLQDEVYQFITLNDLTIDSMEVYTSDDHGIDNVYNYASYSIAFDTKQIFEAMCNDISYFYRSWNVTINPDKFQQESRDDISNTHVAIKPSKMIDVYYGFENCQYILIDNIQYDPSYFESRNNPLVLISIPMNDVSFVVKDVTKPLKFSIIMLDNGIRNAFIRNMFNKVVPKHNYMYTVMELKKIELSR